MNYKLMLQILIGEFHDKLKLLKNLVIREIKFPIATNKIKVAIGMRRTGKTYFLYQKILEMINDIDKSTILYLNFEDDRLLPLDEKKLAKLVDAFYELYPENHDKKCYLFFDEIQNVKNWSIVIRRLHDTKNAEFFLTGSSAKMLSKEISTSLRGRSLAIEIWPYNFNEFMKAKNISIDKSLFDKKTQDKLNQVFNCYLSEGGFPEIITYEKDIKQKTLQEYLDVVIFRDIVERHNIKNSTIVKYMILSMIGNVGKPFAVNKFYNDLKTQGYQVSKDTLYEYVDYIEDSFVAFPISIYDKSIRKTQINPKKLYAIDTGLIRALTLDYQNDFGRLFENIVFLDLKRLGCEVNYYFTKERYEIDFLAKNPKGHKKIFQVVWNQQDINTFNRENRALQSAMNELKIDGEIVTLDSYLQHGIKL